MKGVEVEERGSGIRVWEAELETGRGTEVGRGKRESNQTPVQIERIARSKHKRNSEI